MRGLEWMWGEGFLSPGGAEEVAEIVNGVDLSGAHVLDIGCGIAGVDIALVQNHGVAQVTGIDIEQPLVDRGRELVAAKGLQDTIKLHCVEPGPLPFADDSFDAVFSKDSLIHIPDKAFIYAEIHRVLKPGGWVALSDWLGAPEPPSPAMQEWLRLVGLTFTLDTLEHIAEIVTDTGFELVQAEDRNQWYASEMLKELDSISGENFPKLVNAIGESAANQRVKSSSAKFEIVKGGELRPGHIRARKPVA